MWTLPKPLLKDRYHGLLRTWALMTISLRAPAEIDDAIYNIIEEQQQESFSCETIDYISYL
jgi:hypothetical protein